MSRLSLPDNDVNRQALVAVGALLSGIWSSLQSLLASVATLLGQERPVSPSQSLSISSSSRASAALHLVPTFSAAPREPHFPVSKQYSGEAGRYGSFFCYSAPWFLICSL